MDSQIVSLIAQEVTRQQDTLMLIPSENYASSAVRSTVGSVLNNKYSEGYPGHRYYEGNTVIDAIENLARDRARALFGVPYVNVQPYSGSPANSEILLAIAPPGAVIMGLKLSMGGHLTHGHPKVTFSGRYYTSIQFGLTPQARIDYDEMASLAVHHRPVAIILGTTAYPFRLDWQRAREIADSVGAYLIADISHIAGLIIAGAHPSPVEHADIIMTTTHKTLRGPRGAMILVTNRGLKKDPSLPKKIDAAVIPGMQGGPHNSTTAAIATALFEADTEAFRRYGQQIVTNASALAGALQSRGIKLVGGGTENHLMILDCSSMGIGGGVILAKALAASGIVANFNTIPTDTSPFYPSGVRLGTPAITSRGMQEPAMQQIATWIAAVQEHCGDIRLPEDKTQRSAYITSLEQDFGQDTSLQAIRNAVRAFLQDYPIPEQYAT